MKVGEALAASGLSIVEARLLLERATGWPRVTLIARPEHELSEPAARDFIALSERRRAGEPVAYLLCEREFYGLSLAVGPAVLIPRPESELLVELALERLAPGASDRVLDLGTGSGAVALAIKHERPDAAVCAVEASPAALEVARSNARRLALVIEFFEGRWFEPLGARRFELIVGNPPYVARGDPYLATGDLRFEPREALVAGADGLDAIREIVKAAAAYLEPGGWICLEHGIGQGAAVRALFAQAGLADVQSWPDLAGIARVTGARLTSLTGNG
ncbi:MAG: peptide chain release factor N(5)-glutamine methyltransferase [Betaproteobacteria bacterium]|nr:peptide chain release factor N(5)-glutamine methyltransferase [Betaproteobacteria bacterium]